MLAALGVLAKLNRNSRGGQRIEKPLIISPFQGYLKSPSSAAGAVNPAGREMALDRQE
jgi:hypothetical protein